MNGQARLGRGRWALEHVRARVFVLALVIAFTAMASASTLAAPKIYVNTSAIDARTDLTATQKTEIKTAMLAEVKANLDQAFGSCNTEVTSDSAQQSTAARTVTVDGTTPGTGIWGRWVHGSSGATVYLKNYMDRGDNRFKNADGTWNTTQLGKALATTAAHEVAHGYSASHDDTNINKMNTANSHSQLGGGLNLNNAAKTTLQNNRNSPPCNPSAKSTDVACIADHNMDPVSTLPDAELHEEGSITTTFDFSGPVSSMFDFGWWGTDTDNGAIDGNPFGDFIYKSSMTGTDFDSPAITYFDGWTVQFVLRGRPDTTFAGQYLQIDPAHMVLDNPVVQPDGDVVYRNILLSWKVDPTDPDPTPDVRILMSADIFGPDNQLGSGFRLGHPDYGSVANAKMKVDGHMVRLHNAAITAIFPDYFYIEATDRSAGIRVNWLTALPADYREALVEGKIATGANGEREVDASSVQLLEPMSIRPLGMVNRALGGGHLDYMPGLWASGQQGFPGRYGPNSVGLLVRVVGKFEYIDETRFSLDDGSGEAIVCILPEPMQNLHWNFASATGICSSELTDDGVKPVVLVRSLEEVQPF